MADIGSRSVGNLNVKKVIKGYQRTFMTVHPGDISANTFTATVDAFPVGTTVSYDAITEKTYVHYTITAENSALLSVGRHAWHMIMTENSVPVPYLEGFFEVETL
jgi:hypothetical protein